MSSISIGVLLQEKHLLKLFLDTSQKLQCRHLNFVIENYYIRKMLRLNSQNLEVAVNKTTQLFPDKKL